MVVASMKSQLAGKMGEFIAQTFKTIDKDTANRLRIAIDYGTKMFDHVSLDKILVAAAGQEIQSGASECFNSAVDLAMDYVYDKLMDALKSTTVNLKSAQVAESLADADSAAVAAVPVSPRHDKKEKEKKEKKEKKAEKEKEKEKKKKKEEKDKKKEEKPEEKEEEQAEEKAEEEKEEEKVEEKEPVKELPPTPSGGMPAKELPPTPTGAQPAGMMPRRAPPVPPGSRKPPPGRVGANPALAAALAAGPVSPVGRRPMMKRPAPLEEAAVAEKPAVAPMEEDKNVKMVTKKLPPVKATKTREISYKVSGGETVLGVAVGSNSEHTPALTHPTKDRVRGPAGRKGGARRPPTHKNYTLTDPTAQLQPTML